MPLGSLPVKVAPDESNRRETERAENHPVRICQKPCRADAFGESLHLQLLIVLFGETAFAVQFVVELLAGQTPKSSAFAVVGLWNVRLNETYVPLAQGIVPVITSDDPPRTAPR